MAIIGTLSNSKCSQAHTCVICGSEVPFDQLTGGLVDVTGAQEFACYGHTWDGNKLILGWTAFAIRQRQLTVQAVMQIEYSNRAAVREVYIERRPVTGNEVVSWDIAHHFFARQLQGTTVILTGNPAGLLAALCKQWVRITRKVQRERSSTLDATVIEQLTETIAHMQSMAFTSKPPYDHPYADVYILNYEQLQDAPLNCHTLYAVEPIEHERLKVIKETLPYLGLLIFYR